MNNDTMLNKIFNVLKQPVFWINSLILYISIISGFLALMTTMLMSFNASSNGLHDVLFVLTILVFSVIYMGIGASMHYFSFKKQNVITFPLSLLPFSLLFVFLIFFSPFSVLLGSLIVIVIVGSFSAVIPYSIGYLISFVFQKKKTKTKSLNEQNQVFSNTEKLNENNIDEEINNNVNDDIDLNEQEKIVNNIVYVKNGSKEKHEKLIISVTGLIENTYNEFIPPLNERMKVSQENWSEKGSLLKYLEDLNNYKLIVAYDKDIPVGFVAFELDSKNRGLENIKNNVTVVSMAVLSNYRRSGIARNFMNMIEEENSNVIVRTWNTNRGYINLLERLNYKHIASIKNDRKQNVDTVYYSNFQMEHKTIPKKRNKQ